MKCAFEVGHRSKKRAAGGDALRAHFVDGESVGQFDRRRDHLVERFRAELAQGQQTRIHHARHQRRHQIPPPE